LNSTNQEEERAGEERFRNNFRFKKGKREEDSL
jgi:hypothetical protein